MFIKSPSTYNIALCTLQTYIASLRIMLLNISHCWLQNYILENVENTAHLENFIRKRKITKHLTKRVLKPVHNGLLLFCFLVNKFCFKPEKWVKIAVGKSHFTCVCDLVSVFKSVSSNTVLLYYYIHVE